MTRFKLLSILLIFLLLGNTARSPVLAEINLEITANGESSQNDIQIQSSEQNTLTQTNQSQTQNTVESVSNTGANTASANTGESTISTGDSITNIAVSNSANSSSAAVDSCCQSPQVSSINDNGSSSANSIDQATTAQTTSTITNNANITNEISVTANTGRNSSTENTGDVAIRTGDVTVNIGTENIANYVTTHIAPYQTSPASSEVISGNGHGSSNSVASLFSTTTTSNIFNISRISNKIHADVDTGGNTANSNSGEVRVTTGNIFLGLKLITTVNRSHLALLPTCCEPTSIPTVTPTLTPTPTTAPTPGPIGGLPTPTPTPIPSSPAPSGGEPVSTTSPSSATTSSSTIPDQILGLSATGDQLEILSNLLYIVALVCLASSSKHLLYHSPKRRRK